MTYPAHRGDDDVSLQEVALPQGQHGVRQVRQVEVGVAGPHLGVGWCTVGQIKGG